MDFLVSPMLFPDNVMQFAWGWWGTEQGERSQNLALFLHEMCWIYGHHPESSAVDLSESPWEFI